MATPTEQISTRHSAAFRQTRSRGRAVSPTWIHFYPLAYCVTKKCIPVAAEEQRIVARGCTLGISRYFSQNLWGILVDSAPWIAGLATVATATASRLAMVHMYIPNNTAIAINATNADDVETLPTPLYGLGVTSRKFRVWVGYHQNVNSVHGDDIQSRLYFVMRPQIWQEAILDAWKKGHLLSCEQPSHTTERRTGENLVLHNFDGYIGILEDEMEDDRDHSKLTAFLRDEYGPEYHTT